MIAIKFTGLGKPRFVRKYTRGRESERDWIHFESLD